jgi:Icc protein
MRIAQISDTHILATGSDDPSAALRAECLARCVADINRERPDAVILTGDTVQHGEPDEYAHLRALLAPLEAPLYLVPGNRDDRDALRAAFADLAHMPKNSGFLHYTIEDHPLRLVALDSTEPGKRKGSFCATRQTWLDEVLSGHTDKPTVLFIHHPPFDVGDHYVGGYRRPEEAVALADVVARHRQVVRLLCGHVHCAVERPWAGTVASIMPSVAVDVRKGDYGSEVGARPVYQLHKLAGATGLATETKAAA